MFTRHQLYQLYEEGREPTVRLIESLLDYIEELKHDPHNRRQRQIADLSERIKKPAARLKRVEEKLARQQCLNYELKRRPPSRSRQSSSAAMTGWSGAGWS